MHVGHPRRRPCVSSGSTSRTNPTSIGDLDIEDFPTILLARGDRVLFFGPVLPHAQTLDRLVRNALDNGMAVLSDASLAPDVRALPARLREHADL